MNGFLGGFALLLAGSMLNQSVASARESDPFISAGEVSDIITDRSKSEQDIATTLVTGFMQGLMFATAWNDLNDQAEIFCLPEGNSLDGHKAVALFQAFLAKKPRFRDQPAPMVMMLSLQDAFPCRL